MLHLAATAGFEMLARWFHAVWRWRKDLGSRQTISSDGPRHDLSGKRACDEDGAGRDPVPLSSEVRNFEVRHASAPLFGSIRSDEAARLPLPILRIKTAFGQ